MENVRNANMLARWPCLTSKRVARVCQHQLSFLSAIAVNTMIFAKCRDCAVIFRVYVILHNLREYFPTIYLVFQQKKFCTNLLLHISRTFYLLTQSSSFF